jgi:hypothetical protein
MTGKRRIAVAAIVSGAVVTMVLLYPHLPLNLGCPFGLKLAGPVAGRELASGRSY